MTVPSSKVMRISLDPSREDCFVVLPAAFAASLERDFYAGQLPSRNSGAGVAPLQLDLVGGAAASGGASNGNRRYVGSPLRSPHSGPDNAVKLSPAFARTLLLQEGDLVEVKPLRPDAAKELLNIVVEPASVDDSEVVEANQRQIENVLLRLIRVVSPGMKIPVPIHLGLRTTLVVGELRFVDGATSASAGATACGMLAEGTELFVATRRRHHTAARQDGDPAARPRIGVLKVVAGPKSLEAPQRGNVAAACVTIAAATQEEFRWTVGAAVGVVDLAVVAATALADLNAASKATVHPVAGSSTQQQARDGSTVAAAAADQRFSVAAGPLLRQAKQFLLAVEDTDAAEGILSIGECYFHFNPAPFPVGATLYVFPSPPTQVPPYAAEASLSQPGAVNVVGLERVGAVHGSIVAEVVSSIRAAFSHGTGASVGYGCDPGRGEGFVAAVEGLQTTGFAGGCCPTASPHLLLCGGKGSGKSTVARTAAATCGAKLVTVGCAGAAQKDILSKLRAAFAEAVASAPAVLLIDDFDAAFPADVEGGPKTVAGAAVESMAHLLSLAADASAPYHEYGVGRPQSNVVAASTERRATRHAAWSPLRLVLVLATAQSREAVHEALRTSRHFASILKIPALSSEGRVALLRQELAALTAESALDVAHHMDGYSAHDVAHVARRIAEFPALPPPATDGSTGDAPDWHAACRAAIDKYVPLAHGGTKFLKGQSLTWNDVGGMAEPRKVLYDALVLPSRFPELFATLPLKTRSGVLLYGPPGCGKSFIVSALVAAERLNCIVVNGPEILDKYIGASEQKVREVFERAQAAAPCVLFFDEFDSIAPHRGHDNTGVTDRVVNQLLCYLDGVEGRTNVFVVAASSRPDLIDAALLRPGRLDKAVYCAPPTLEDRFAVLQAHAGKLRPPPATDVLRAVAQQCDGWTAADLAGLVSSVNLRAVQRRIDTTLQLAALNIGGSTTAKATSGGACAEDGDAILSVGGGSGILLLGGTRDSRAAAAQKLAAPSPSALSAWRITAAATTDALREEADRKLCGTAAALESASMSDFEICIADTRPSISPHEWKRYEMLYGKFSKQRDGASQPDTPIAGTRTSMA